uniref:Fibrinogen C-terminal domain-containing protein n=1 Tax=Strigamia maritima TaxID=126957 RepID=T1IRG7_STRMM
MGAINMFSFYCLNLMLMLIINFGVSVQVIPTISPFAREAVLTTKPPGLGFLTDLPSRHPTGNQQQQEMLFLVQRIYDRITGMESRENQRTRKLDTIDYRLTKLEVLIQERSNVLEKIETVFGKRMEVIEWEMNKLVGLLEVLRDEVEKTQQNQVNFKVDLAKLIPFAGSDGSTDQSSSSIQPAKFQVLQTQLNNLRKMTDSIDQKMSYLQVNMTNTNNMTKLLVREQTKCVQKEFFYSIIREISEQLQSHPISIITSTLTTDKNERSFPNDCSAVLSRDDGIYQIQPVGSRTPFFVYCDLTTDGGGWTVIQKRTDGHTNFYRGWQDYKNGFGNIMGEHWLGNEKLHLLTNQAVYSLRFELEDFDEEKTYAYYSTFAIGRESEGYMIKMLGGYDGEAGDSFNYHSSMKFSTKDMDNDPWEGGNCAELHTGAWWYNGCGMSNLNGQYLGGEVPENFENKGMYWYEWHGPNYSLRKSEIKIRPMRNKTQEPTSASSNFRVRVELLTVLLYIITKTAQLPRPPSKTAVKAARSTTQRPISSLCLTVTVLQTDGSADEIFDGRKHYSKQSVMALET